MAFNYLGKLNVPNYTCLSTDLDISNKVVGISTPGFIVFLTDTGVWKIVGDDLALLPYALPISGTITVTGGLTDAQLRATPVPVSGTVTNGAGSNLIGKVGIDQATANANEVVVKSITAGETHIGQLGGRSIIVGDETTRPAGTDIYAIGDAVSATTSDTATTPLRSLAVGRVNGGSGYLTKFGLNTDQKTCVAAVRVHFYNVAAPTGPIVGDNVTMTLLYLNKAQRMGYIDMPALATSTVSTNSTMAVSQNISDRMQFKCASNDMNIYYRLETLTVFTPADSQKFYLEVAAEQD